MNEVEIAKELDAKELLQPILDVFGGADGGTAFCKMRHEVVPTALASPEVYAKALLSIRSFSALCSLLLEEG